MFAGAGDDILIDDSGTSSNMNGEAGNDSMTGGTGNDYMVGGAGNDTIAAVATARIAAWGTATTTSSRPTGTMTASVVLDGGPGSNQLFALVGLATTMLSAANQRHHRNRRRLRFHLCNGGDDDRRRNRHGFIYGNAGNDFIYTDDLITNSKVSSMSAG
jgi:Ca2+-binding RTX toxin-like protein